ncbi:hypothetical protein I4U23_007154 [Adineta vaga]|nr:hypothetical protein I4U23_007154 [Adineta vaga]
MEFFNQNANRKRKLSQSKEQEESLKRKDTKSVGCFGRCCSRKDQNIPSEQKEKIPLKNDFINQQLRTVSGVGNKISSIPITHLSRSPLYNESKFCQKTLESYHDPCIEWAVQNEPDVWENIPKNTQNSSEQLRDTNMMASIEKVDAFLKQKINSTKLDNSLPNKSLHCIENQVNSFINDIIGDGVDRMAQILTKVYYNNKQTKINIEDTPSTNSAIIRQENDSNNRLLDSTEQSKYRYDSLVFQKQNWDIESNMTKSQNQEPYNWDLQEYSWPSIHEQSQKNSLLNGQTDESEQKMTDHDNILLSDDDTNKSTYSIVSSLPSNQKNQVFVVKKSSLSLNHSFQHKPISTEVFNQDISELHDRFSSTSINELLEHMTHGKQQKSFDLDSISTAYSIPISIRPSVLPEIINDRNHCQPSQTSINKKHHSIPAKQISSIFTYDEILSSWRYYLERYLSFILPSNQTTTKHDIDLSSSIITSHSHSWSTATCTDVIQSDNIGPWWGRRDVDDHTPATFIFANEPLSTWYSLEINPDCKQMCTSMHNQSCCSQENDHLTAYHYYCSSSPPSSSL